MRIGIVRLEYGCLFVALALAGAGRAADSRPETWFHFIGGNVSRAGIRTDLEAIRAAGYGGIQLFHGQVGEADVWEGTDVRKETRYED